MAVEFTAHNIRLDDGRFTKPDIGPAMEHYPWFVSARRVLETVFPGDKSRVRVADLGCLEGGYSVEFARMGFQVLGLEVRESNIAACRYVKANTSLPNLQFVQDDAWNIAKYGNFDAIFCCGLLYHLDRPNEFLKTLSGVTNRLLILQTHFSVDEPGDDKFNLSPITEHECRRGRWYTEFSSDSDFGSRDNMKWSSWDNRRSFWIQREHLLQAIQDVGFDLVMEQFDSLGNDIADAMTRGYYRTDKRGTFIGIRCNSRLGHMSNQVEESSNTAISDRASACNSTVGAVRIQRTVTDPSLCDFYHTVELADGSLIKGAWDLRRGVTEYLGGVEFSGKTVLEIGPGGGFLSFHMEKDGAEVTSIEPPIDTFWDLVPRAAVDIESIREQFRAHIERIRNSFWYLHTLNHSGVKLFEANAYDLPSELGRFDIGLLASILLHCSSPVRMIESVSRRVNDTLIICEMSYEDLGNGPICSLAPAADNNTVDTWWRFTPEFFVNYLGVVGFTNSRVVRHRQLHASSNAWIEMFTVVASRAY